MTEDASKENLRHRLAEKMAGEITLSDKPGEALKNGDSISRSPRLIYRHIWVFRHL